jgi:hypothetical protein
MHDHDNKSDKDNWQNNHKEDEYARNDTDAKNYRDIYDVINIVQGSTVFSSSDDKGRTFAVIGWHDGFPYSTYFNYANSINTSSFSEWLTACFTWKHS